MQRAGFSACFNFKELRSKIKRLHWKFLCSRFYLEFVSGLFFTDSGWIHFVEPALGFTGFEEGQDQCDCYANSIAGHVR